MFESLRRANPPLNVFIDILNGLDSFVYVSDLDTDKILFINKKQADQYDASPEDLVGKLCWQVLPAGQQGRCDFCPIRKLEQDPEAIISWIYYGENTGRYYRKTDRIIEWGDNKKAHLQQSIDITELVEAEAALEKKLKQQELMFKVSQSFISTEDINTLVGRALHMVGEFMEADKIIIADVKNDKGNLARRFGWHNEKTGIRGLSEQAGVSFGPGSGIHDAFVVNKLPYVACSDIDTMPQFAYMRNFGVKSFLIAPVYLAGEFWGAIIIDDCRRKRCWEEGDINVVQLLASIIAGIVARDEVENELKRMSSLVDSSPQAIIYIGAGGELHYINRGAELISGYSREELHHNGLGLVFDSETMQRTREEIKPAIFSGGEQYYEVPMIRNDGQIRTLMVTSFATGFEGESIGVIATDITEKKKLEQELIEAKEQAERSNRAKSDFLSRMSHEMRTPMTAVIGMTTIAKSADTPERKDYCLRRIESASNHLLGVINDVLDLSKIEANKLELSYGDFIFQDMLAGVANVVNYRVEEKHQRLVIKVGEDVPVALISDEQRLSQVITNLLGNAVKFTPEEGEISLFVDKIAEDEQQELCTLRFEARDTGIGISPEQLQRLFKPFEQADGGISRRFGGTGLGLAISKSIVELLGGEIWVESEEGRGSSFFFTMQAYRGRSVAHDDSPVDVAGPDLSCEPEDGIFCGYHMLLAEDVAINCEIVMALLEHTGIEIECAGNGREVYQKFAADPSAYDVIFMDIQMPEMDGYEATRLIRELDDEHAQAIPIIAMTANVFREDIEACMFAGMNDHVGKPLEIEDIVEKLRQYLL